jgi:hypothetical protein
VAAPGGLPAPHHEHQKRTPQADQGLQRTLQHGQGGGNGQAQCWLCPAGCLPRPASLGDSASRQTQLNSI